MKKAQLTRQTILQKAFELIYTNGYQKTSIDDILNAANVTKGAFYYHFHSKDEMGLAIINDNLKPSLINSFIVPLSKEDDPLSLIYKLMYSLLMKNDFMKVEYGCPASNLVQEMTPWHSDFSKAIEELTVEWNRIMISTLEDGKKKGYVRKDVNAKQVTLFVMSGYWGVRNFGKLENSKGIYIVYLKELKNYLSLLRQN